MWDYRVFVEDMYSLNVYTNIPRQAKYITIKYGDPELVPLLLHISSHSK